MYAWFKKKFYVFNIHKTNIKYNTYFYNNLSLTTMKVNVNIIIENKNKCHTKTCTTFVTFSNTVTNVNKRNMKLKCAYL